MNTFEVYLTFESCDSEWKLLGTLLAEDTKEALSRAKKAYPEEDKLGQLVVVTETDEQVRSLVQSN